MTYDALLIVSFGGPEDSVPAEFTAHSIPLDMAEAGPKVEPTPRFVPARVRDARPPAGALAYQSPSGPPTRSWLEPDIGDHIRQLRSAGGLTDIVVMPIGFLSDHMEVICDLDTETAALCRELGVNLVRAATVGVHPAFVSANPRTDPRAHERSTTSGTWDIGPGR